MENIDNLLSHKKVWGRLVEIDPKSITVDQVADVLQRIKPNLWKQIYVKHIENPGSHYGYKAAACLYTNAVLEFESQVRDDRKGFAGNMCAVVSLLQQHDFPTYYVSRSIMEALSKTHPPVDMAWADLTFPFDAMTFMIPRGLLYEPTSGEEIMCVGFGRHMVGQDLRVISSNIKIYSNASRITVFWGLAPGIGEQDTTFPLDHKLEPDAKWINEKTIENGLNQPLEDTEFAVYIAGLVANFLLLMDARKELVEGGSLTGKKLKASGVPIYLPRYIGRKYQTAATKASTDPKSHYTELRWRAGHMKRQRYGKGRAEVKTIWIEPYIAYSAGLKLV